MQTKYDNYNIPLAGVNLRKNKLPYEDDFFDVVIICEVIEYLNFNPLPIMQEINRILKKEGYLYISMPNQAKFDHRLSLLKGKSIHDPIKHYFTQLDRSDNMIVGLHWREYTMPETKEIIESMGFQTHKAYYWQQKFQIFGRIFSKKWIKNIVLKWLLSNFPSYRNCHIVIGQKKDKAKHQFWLTEANS